MNRRELLKRSALLAFTPGAAIQSLFAGTSAQRLQVGACDWSIGKSCDIGAFAVAKQIGLEGIQVNMGSLNDNLRMRKKEVQELHKAESKRTGVKIASLALGQLNSTPYKSDPRTDEWVWDSIDAAENMNAKVILLAFFYANELRNDDKGKKEVVRKLKEVMPKAEKKNIVLGIESYLSAEEHMDIIQKVGSKNLKIYYDFRNSADAGYDVIKEIKWLGKDVICELHMKENGFLLGAGTLNWNKIAETLLEMGYAGNGWMQIEGASPENSDVVENYKHNHAYLKNVFKY